MGRAGKALKQVLESYGITQNRLAVMMGIDRSNVSRWVNQTRDPSAEAVAQIKDALEGLDPQAAEEFVMLYFYQTSNKAEGLEPDYLDGASDGSTQRSIDIVDGSIDGSTNISIDERYSLAEGGQFADGSITNNSSDSSVREGDGSLSLQTIDSSDRIEQSDGYEG